MPFGGGLSKKEKQAMRKEFGPFDAVTDEQRDGFSSWADKRVLEWMQTAQSELGDRFGVETVSQAMCN